MAKVAGGEAGVCARPDPGPWHIPAVGLLPSAPAPSCPGTRELSNMPEELRRARWPWASQKSSSPLSAPAMAQVKSAVWF